MSETVLATPAAAPARRRDGLRGLLRKPLFVVSALITLLYLAMAAFPGLFTSVDPRACSLAFSGVGPSSGHPFGYDLQGCDYLANIIYGTRSSISIGLLVTVATFVLAAVFGGLAGYFGGLVDGVVSRTADIMFGLPFIVAAIVVLNMFPQRDVLSVSLVLIVLGWPGGMRYMRGSVLKVRNLEYVQAARVLGSGHTRVLLSHVMPNSLTPLIVLKTLEVGAVIAAEAALTFLGVGLQPPAISWGLQLSAAHSQWQAHPHLVIFPSIFLSLAVLAFVVLGDSLRDALDPKER
ncbi:oligopeptide transport system permease protein [Streptoalloteichus tenebrarius]|uniref:Oligopeptide transport system permease protein n=1 Tax=Streptoalloteichus tenebrarius (strain ATCC 17920 / DSM 40477 / JCM 4838 / CBS 697.72 / NBRC 16177 / NCIMB 11028 / NRRL B-12390 / A12253. 1 / ISP 5477) TaxID=1933 RepID=A0ABT1HRV2_STRSD|nr:ABC transporter permease [Streptoalloteichus tenebrarius]MCP2258251.1 oligopeptide transport system permease protein [Streptoalloteichus tenebrarius]BFF04519.1 ABC transporter permease [Streptoalloteichus tenebrarius]